MIVKVYEDLENFDEFNFNVDNIKDILSGIKMLKGEEYSNTILNFNYKYILTSNDININPISLNNDTILSNLNGYDNLFLFPEVSGQIEEAVIIALAVDASVATTAGTSAIACFVIENAAAIAIAANIAISVGVSMALNGIMQLLSPTTSFSSDPAQAQQKQSSLFNGAPLIREQGGSVPLWYGSSYIGGVLVSSSISTAEG